MEKNCGFCAELAGDLASEFLRRYRVLRRNRFVYRDDDFCAFPSLGQISLGHTLLVPIKHYENLANLPIELRPQLQTAISRVESLLARFGSLFIFEHGARMLTGGGCGIYHAHLHMVPFDRTVSVQDLELPINCWHDSFFVALDSVKDQDQYLLLRDDSGRVAVLSGTDFGSQFMRRCLVKKLALRVPEDWRLAAQFEPAMEQALAMFPPIDHLESRVS